MSTDAGKIVVADDAAVNRMLLTGILEATKSAPPSTVATRSG